MNVLNQPKILVPNINKKISSSGELIDQKFKETLLKSIDSIKEKLDIKLNTKDI